MSSDPAVTRFPHPINPQKVALSPEIKKKEIEKRMKEILEILGLDLSDPSLAESPSRIARMYVDEIFSGLDAENFPAMTFYDEKILEQCILIKNISLISFCEHHFVPMVGSAHVAYIPHKKILGFSKIHRIVRYFAARPQLQERLTAQIADSLSLLLETEDVAVLTHAKHFCVVARGVEDVISEAESHVLLGKFNSDPALRSEFFTRINREDAPQENPVANSTFVG